MNDKFTLLYKTDIPDANGRIWPKEVVREALKEYEESLINRTANGEFILKSNYDRTDYTQIDIEKISHRIIQYEEVPEGFKIRARCLDTPAGKMLLDSFNEDEVKFGIRGEGEVNAEDKKISNLKIIAIDVLEKI